jgi:hypothetical protein
MHATSDFEGELAALRRALELQVDQGLVLDAIASCKAILALRPDDAQTLDTLDLLYLNRQQSDVGSSIRNERENESTDAALDSMLLTQLVPGARSVQFAGAHPGRISEIPIEEMGAVPQTMSQTWQPRRRHVSPHRPTAGAGRVRLPTRVVHPCEMSWPIFRSSEISTPIVCIR